MIDENKNCVTRSKLAITLKTLSTYNDWSRVAAKQTNRPKGTETGKRLGRKTY